MEYYILFTNRFYFSEADKVSQKKLLAVEQAGVGDLDKYVIHRIER